MGDRLDKFLCAKCIVRRYRIIINKKTKTLNIRFLFSKTIDLNRKTVLLKGSRFVLLSKYQFRIDSWEYLDFRSQLCFQILIVLVFCVICCIFNVYYCSLKRKQHSCKNLMHVIAVLLFSAGRSICAISTTRRLNACVVIHPTCCSLIGSEPKLFMASHAYVKTLI